MTAEEDPAVAEEGMEVDAAEAVETAPPPEADVETAPPPSSSAPPPREKNASGTILEAAFVDPAYTWPPEEGEGKNAIELQASINLVSDDASDVTTESMKERMQMPDKPERVKKVAWWKCCQNDEAVVQEYEEYRKNKVAALQARKEHAQKKRDAQKRAKGRAKQYRKDHKYDCVPEGILIYRLDTSKGTIQLVSAPHSKTDLDTLMTEMTVVRASPSPDKSRRAMELVGEDGNTVTLVSCEQRTATAWLEAMNLMTAKKDRSGFFSWKDVSFVRDDSLLSPLLCPQNPDSFLFTYCRINRNMRIAGTRKSSRTRSSMKLKTNI